MNLKRTGLAAIATVGAIGVLAPVGSASAATLPSSFNYAFPAYNWSPANLPAFNPGSLSFVGPSVGGLSAVIGPTVITVGVGNIFTGTTITTTGGGAVVNAGTGAP